MCVCVYDHRVFSVFLTSPPPLFFHLSQTAQVSELADYQLSQGGFVEEGRNTPSAKATFEAIFSAVILGQKHQVCACVCVFRSLLFFLHVIPGESSA